MGALSLPFGNFSFGLRSTAVAAILLLIGAAVLFVALKSSPNTSVAGGNQVPSQSVTPESNGGNLNPVNGVVKSGSDDVAKGPIEQDHLPEGRAPKVPGMRREIAGVRSGNRFGARDMSQKGAQVDRVAGTYPTAAFPIDASYQSLKVSVDDARGASRTISLPSVSFGSQKTLSQTASPFLATARDTW